MIYLLLGEDGPAKDKKISEIKNHTIRSNEALKFDFEMLYGPKLPADTLKKAILSLPVVSPARLVIIRSIEKLSAHNQEILADFCNVPDERLVLILESPSGKIKGDFFDKVQEKAKIFHFAEAKKLNVFDMTKAMQGGNSNKALKILSELLTEGTAPLMLMGGIIWFWGKCRPRVAANDYHKGLAVLREADLNIKRSRLKPEHALELLVVKLTSLL